LVLTSPDRHADFIELAITSVEQQYGALQIGPTHLVQGTLPKSCWIRFDKVFTLSESSIVKTFGAASPQTMQAVLQGLCSVVGYARKSSATPSRRTSALRRMTSSCRCLAEKLS
jgi:mRNA interferase MazF